MPILTTGTVVTGKSLTRSVVLSCNVANGLNVYEFSPGGFGAKSGSSSFTTGSLSYAVLDYISRKVIFGGPSQTAIAAGGDGRNSVTQSSTSSSTNANEAHLTGNGQSLITFNNSVGPLRVTPFDGLSLGAGHAAYGSGVKDYNDSNTYSRVAVFPLGSTIALTWIDRLDSLNYRDAVIETWSVNSSTGNLAKTFTYRNSSSFPIPSGKANTPTNVFISRRPAPDFKYPLFFLSAWSQFPSNNFIEYRLTTFKTDGANITGVYGWMVPSSPYYFAEFDNRGLVYLLDVGQASITIANFGPSGISTIVTGGYTPSGLGAINCIFYDGVADVMLVGHSSPPYVTAFPCTANGFAAPLPSPVASVSGPVKGIAVIER